jgi:thiamine-monophosphate kinase
LVIATLNKIMNEFELITHFFADHIQTQRDDVVMGIGDDCAILEVPPGQQLLISMDTLVSGVHFPVSTTPYDIGYKALAVNLSDLAAMGANPAWISLALTLPSADQHWLSAFSEGLFSLAKLFNVVLIGGDTTRGPLTITIQAHGFVPVGQAITRCKAQPGDLIYVTHTLGDAGLALKHLNQEIKIPSMFSEALLSRLNRPLPRIKEGLLLRNQATSMIDLSDGLISDLEHILKKSLVGAVIHLDKIPLSTALKQSVSREDALKFALTSGDDYELCFTVPEHKKIQLETLMSLEHCEISCIGHITNTQKLVLQQGDHYIESESLRGYTHF